MKKLCFVMLVGLFVLTSCQPSAESYIGDMKDLVEKVTEEGSEYTAEQWKEVSQKFEELVKKAEELGELTAEQKKEIAKLQGKFSGVVVKKGFDKLMDDAGKELEKAGEAIGAFLDGLTEEE